MARNGPRSGPQKAQRDETRYCERCGITFLWPVEEQREGVGPPPQLCTGCRALLPAAGRERGVVKWYNVRKRYGFIVRREQTDLFVHGSELADVRRLSEGDLVEFTVAERDGGLAAQNVELLAGAGELAGA